MGLRAGHAGDTAGISRPAIRCGRAHAAAAAVLALVGAAAGLGGCADPEALAADQTGGGTNISPSASFTTSCTALACDVDAAASSDSDGSIAAYAWVFGDGSTASGVTTSHSFATAGSYTIALTVTDDGGATALASQSVTVAPGGSGNNPPSAAFSASCTNLACSFDASASVDGDGSIASYAWDFGDGATAMGSIAGHSYAAEGSYSVTLTVSDNVGATATATQTVSVTGGGGSLDGQTLYSQNCASCHGADATGGNLARISIVGATADDIQLAIDTVPNMSSLKSMTTAQIQAIANYLGSLVVGTTLGRLSNGWSEITLTDASGTTVTTLSDPNTGTFVVDASALDGAILAAAYFPTDGTTLYGYADGAGVLNITPLTTEAVRLASGGALDSACAGGVSACFLSIPPASLEFAEAWLAFDLADSFASFAVDGSGQWMNEPFDLQLGSNSGMSALIAALPDGLLGN